MACYDSRQLTADSNQPAVFSSQPQSFLRKLEMGRRLCDSLQRAMSPQEYDRLAKLIADPPKGSKLAAAKEFGIDLTLLLENLRRSPTERIQVWLSALSLHEELRRAGSVPRQQ